jgi:enamine deaminase RidA (YjgF/YER057c/UK114 family)
MRARASSGSPHESRIGFSRAIRTGHHVCVAGTAAVWPSGEVDADVGVQAQRCLEIIAQALDDVNASLADVVRTRVYLVDVADGDAVAAVHGSVFGAIRPASAFIVVSGLLDPRWKVEIEADAIVHGKKRGLGPRSAMVRSWFGHFRPG